MRRIFVTTARLVLLGSLVVLPLLAVTAAAADDPPPVDQREQRQIEREIREKQREIDRFRGKIKKLTSAARHSSNSSRRSAIEDLEEAMLAVVTAAEDRLGEDYRITRHDAEADQVSTRDLEESKGVRTRSKRFCVPGTGENAPPPGYLRLARQQSIYISCRTNREQAIGASEQALAQYQSLVEEFAGLLEAEIAELQAKLPPETGNTGGDDDH